MDPGALFAPQNRKQLEASFQEFLKRPENKPLVEQQQAEEVLAALELRKQQQEAELHAEVQQLPLEYQQVLQPVLKWPVLRQLLLSLSHTATDSSNSSSIRSGAPPSAAAAAEAVAAHRGQSSGQGHLAAWLENDRVLGLLRSATKALRAGKLSEEQLEQALLHSIQGAGQELPGVMGAGAAAAAAAGGAGAHGRSSSSGSSGRPCGAAQVVVPSMMLVEALNEHLAERRQGQQACQKQDWAAAAHHYTRALSIVEFVVGSSPQEQQEVEANAVAVLLELAAVHLAAEEWTRAALCCTKALRLRPSSGLALLLRAKARLGMHECKEAAEDARQLQEVDPWCEELPGLRQSIRAAQKPSPSERDMAARMFGLR